MSDTPAPAAPETPRRTPWRRNLILLVVALAVTLVILRSSRLWVFYQGAVRR